MGLGLARAARGLSVALLAQERREAGPRPADDLDPRVYALSPGNVAFLREIRAWQNVPADRAAPVHAMRIFGDRPGALIEFDAYRAGVPELAWTVEDRILQDAMWQAALGADGVEIVAPALCESLHVEEKQARIGLKGGREISARLVVGADGARSFVREKAGIALRERDYGQAAVVANFECSKPHSNTAFQWFHGGFHGGAVLALLPLPGRRVSMIWSLPSDEAAALSRLDPVALCRAVEAASREELGTLSLATAPRSYPLRRLAASRLVMPRIALAGDAAHVIHPLAGQGLNLGLQDARALVHALSGRAPVADPGDYRLLRGYERSRAEPILSMDFVVDGLFRLFGSRNEVVSRLRNAGLNLTEQLPVLKNLLMRHAMH